MPNGNPWSKFFWSDWQTDANLRRCSKAAKGFWIDCLALAYECDEVGVLATGGEPWSDEDIAAAVCGDSAENLRCLHELLDKGVARRNGCGAVYSKRMVRDEEIRSARSTAGSKGGSKTQANRQAKSKQNLSDSDSDSSPKKKKNGLDRFEEFWSEVPHKIGKGAARKAYANAIANGAAHDEIVAGLPGYAEYERKRRQRDQKDFRPLHPSSWLNAERWTDEVAGVTKPVDSPLANLTQEDKQAAWKRVLVHSPDLAAGGPNTDAGRRAILQEITKGEA